MRACGIICEFNPFHNGHKYLLDSVRSICAPDAVVCVMSGDFTQRGYPALFDKYQRAEAAVKCGADLVLELPVYHVLNGAMEFARGGVRVLKALGCVDTLAFGSESGDSSALTDSAQRLYDAEKASGQEFRNLMKDGLSYPAALQRFAEERNITVPTEPNDILGFEYIKKSLEENCKLNFCAVKRLGAGHDESAEGMAFASSFAIREKLSKASVSELTSAKLNIPEASFEVLSKAQLWNKSCSDRLFELVKYLLSTCSAEYISGLTEAGEGIENRLKSAVIKAVSFEDIIMACKTKRYTYSRISRLLCQLLLGLNSDDYDKIRSDDAAYAKVLAFSETGRKLLKEAKEESQIPVISNSSKIEETLAGSSLFSADLRAASVYSVLTGRSLYEGDDRTKVPYYGKIKS